MVTFYSSTANNTRILTAASLFEKNNYLNASYSHRKRKTVFKFCKEQKSVPTSFIWVWCSEATLKAQVFHATPNQYNIFCASFFPYAGENSSSSSDWFIHFSLQEGNMSSTTHTHLTVAYKKQMTLPQKM